MKRYRNLLTIILLNEEFCKIKNRSGWKKKMKILGESLDAEDAEEQFITMKMRFIKKRLRLKNYLGPQHIYGSKYIFLGFHVSI